MNKVCLTGRLTKDIELKKTSSGTSVAFGSVAVRRDFKENGEYPTDFINWTAWKSQADYLATYAHKGDMVEVTGRWQVRQYQDKSGNNRVANELVIENVHILESAQDNNKVTPPVQPSSSSTTEDDLPF